MLDKRIIDRYDEAAAKLAWERTLEFFRKYLGA